MTNRLKGFTVALSEDIREDDAEAIISAIKMIKGVSDVVPLLSTPDDWMARDRVRRDMADKIFKFWQDLTKPQG